MQSSLMRLAREIGSGIVSEEVVVCECGRDLNLTDWHYGRCIDCTKPVPYGKWKKLI